GVISWCPGSPSDRRIDHRRNGVRLSRDGTTRGSSRLDPRPAGDSGVRGGRRHLRDRRESPGRRQLYATQSTDRPPMSTVVSERARERGRIEEGATATAGDRPAGRRLALRPRIVFSLVIVGLVAACALFPGGIAPHDPLKPDLAARLAPPFWMTGGTMAHPLGTDTLGR